MKNSIFLHYKAIFFIAFPMVLSNISAPLLGLVDTAIVGRIGTNEIGAVAIGASSFSLIYWSFAFLRMCTTGYIAQSWGKNNLKEIEEIIKNTISMAILCGILVLILSIPIREFCLLLLGPSANIKLLAKEYIDIRIWAAPAVFINLVILGILIGSKKPWYVVIITLVTNLINIILDFYLGVFLKYGVTGIALGTLLSEWSGALLSLLIFKITFPNFKLIAYSIKFNNVIKNIIKSNIDFFIRTILLLSSIMLFTAIGARLSDLELAANSILILLQMFLSYGLDGFAQAAEVLVGNAYGSKNKLLFKSIIILTGVISFLISILYSLIYLLFGINIISLITNIQEVIQVTKIYLPWMAVSPLISFLSFHLDGVFIGAAKTKIMRNAMIMSFIIYLASIFLLVPIYGNHGLWLSFLIFMLARGITLLLKLKSIYF